MINNPDVTKFSNEHIRRMADMVITLLNFSNGAQTQLANLVAAGLTNTADTIVDGSPADGRTQITGAQALLLLTALNTFFTNMNPTNKAMLQAVAVNPGTPDYSDLSWNQ